jgi:DNA-binding NtrC family response regulator
MSFEPGKIDLLVVDDDNEFRETVVRRFLRRGFQVQEAVHGEQALQLAERRQFDVVILDLIMPGMTGIQVLERMKASHPDCEVILLTGQGTIETAVEAMKLGAFDFLQKPFPLAELELLIEKAYDRRQLRKENVQLKAALGRAQSAPKMIGQSADRSRRADRQIDFDSGGKRHRQGARRHGVASRQSPGGQTARGDQLRGASGELAGERTVRA